MIQNLTLSTTTVRSSFFRVSFGQPSPTLTSGQLIGEGVDFPNLDCLFLGMFQNSGLWEVGTIRIPLLVPSSQSPVSLLSSREQFE